MANEQDGKRKTSNPFDLVYLASCPLISKKVGKVYAVTPIDLRAELKAFAQTIEDSGKKLRIKRDFATVSRLSANVTLGCNILHYTGHGLETGLAFEDDFGEMHIVETETLRKLIAAGAAEGEVKLVFVAACHSESTGRAFVKAGVKHVIAVKINEKVADKGARIFMNQFYLALFVGRTVADAFHIAKVNLGAVAGLPNPDDECGKYLLLPAKADHNVQIFPCLKEGKIIDCTPTLLGNTPASVDHFMGRSFDVQKIVEAFLKNRKRLVTLCGNIGVGKTAVAIDAAKYLKERGKFKHGVFFICLEDEDEMMDVESIAEFVAERIGLEIPTNERRMLSCLKRELGQKDILLVLDGLDRLQSNKEGRFVRKFIKEALIYCPPLKILTTCRIPVGVQKGIEEVIFPILPMRDEEICIMFNKLAGDLLTADKVGLKGDVLMYTQTEILQKLAMHPLITSVIKGNPGICWQAVHKLKELEDLDKVVMIMRPKKPSISSETTSPHQNHENKSPETPYETFHDPSIFTPNRQDSRYEIMQYEREVKGLLTDANARIFWDVFKPALEVSWGDFTRRLAEHFPKFAETQRGVTAEDLHDICQRVQTLAKRSGLAIHHDRVTIRAFAVWWRDWYVPLISTVRRIRNVWDRNLVMGTSHSKKSIETRIENDPVGSFMLRLSGNNPGCVSMGFVSSVNPKRILHVLILASPRSKDFKVTFSDGNSQTYRTLEELILKCRRVVMVHPNIGKHQAFGSNIQDFGEEDGPS
mmetsp:Transcript_4078/g.7519  ORF Transcript_4078/g.7519 Transcript_4078/m.7519 type:complete len:757 (-) Transcript_4078:257-2527(-)|eukprot:CAMPEP_0197531518 /NCGR_PEP_ID=MMETSP1318-20131121/36026_1 /TAXON_ID=552666 /ORGANISM="Partenskyella glossopodia, Strain RCC365" /LENGTH=756 /DNA_ID=CAMNT_0043087767 /DNA_START=219 /DNA_END=2489 /DNA_ORIENTATION=-